MKRVIPSFGDLHDNRILRYPIDFVIQIQSVPQIEILQSDESISRLVS